MRLIAIGYSGVQTLDLTGPTEVFAMAGFEVVIASASGGDITTTSGLCVRTRKLPRPRPDDTVLVAGGREAGVVRAATDARLLGWLRRARVRRMTSVCSGAFVLAAAGLLAGKRATTHWSACDELARRFPDVAVDRNAIFVTDGTTWTSAGVTTGIDMALALVEADLGRERADAIAARLVLYTRRPGFQSQWSDALVAPADSLGPAIAWARGNLGDVDLDALARRAGLSPRTFHRRCLAQLATTPAKLLDKLRVERARDLLATTDQPVKVLASRCGFSSPARMTRAFERELGIGPRAYRLLHSDRVES